MNAIEIVLVTDAAEAKPLIVEGHKWLGQHGTEAGFPLVKETIVLKAEEAGTCAALLVGTIGFNWMYVAVLATRPDAKGRGFGGRLLSEVEAYAREKGLDGLWLDSYTFEAASYYPRHGFKEFGRIENNPPGQDRVFFQKRL